MKKTIHHFLIVVTWVLLSALQTFAAENPGDRNEKDNNSKDTFPVPVRPNQLFYVQRTPNINTIIYETNFTREGTLNTEEPIHVYWIRYTDGGVTRDLNYIQNHFAYGVKTELLPDGRYKVNFVAYKKRNLYLQFSSRDNNYHIYCSINNKTAILTRIYIQIDPGGSFWSPNVRYLELKGNELVTGKELIERIMIN